MITGSLSGSTRHATAIVAGWFLLLIYAGNALAFISPQTCGDADSDLGTDCSLAELDDSAVIVDNVRFYNISVPLGDADAGYPISSQIRVVPVGEGTGRPGLRFVVENGAMNHDPCVMGTDPVAFNNVSYFVAAANLQLGDIAVHNMTMSGEGFASPDIGEYEFNLAENFSDQSAYSLSEPFPFEFPLADLNMLAVEVGAATRSPGAFPKPEGHCGTQAGISLFEQRVGLRNVPALPPAVSNSGDIPCTVDEKGGLCPTVGVETDAACAPETSGVGVVDVLGVPVVEMTTCSGKENSTSLTQAIATPLSSFEIWFDYRFGSNSHLDVYIDETLIATVPAVTSSTFEREPILVNDPALMGLDGATLRFDLVGDGSAVELANIISPSFELLDAQIDIAGTAHLESLEAMDPKTGQQTIDVNRETYSNRCNLVEDVLEGPQVECTDPEAAPPVLIFGSAVSLGDQTELVESPLVGSSSTCQADSRGFAGFGGVGNGLISSSTRDLSAALPLDGIPRETLILCNASARSGAAYIVRDTSGLLPPGTLIPIRYKLRSHGTVLFNAAAPIAPSRGESFAKLSVTGQVGLDRAYRGLEISAVFEDQARFVFDPSGPYFDPTPQAAPPAGFWLDSNCPDGEDPGDPPEGTPAVTAEFEYFGETEDISAVTFTLDQAWCVPEVFYARLDQIVVVDLDSRLEAIFFGSTLFDGALLADFSDTFHASLSTEVEGIEFVPVGLAELLDRIFRHGFEAEEK